MSGQIGINDLYKYALIIIVLVVVVVVGANILTEVQTTQLKTQDFNVINETFTAVNGTDVSLANYDLRSGWVVWNESAGLETLRNGLDYTVNQPGGTFFLLNNTFNQSTLGINYTYTRNITNDAYNISAQGIGALTTFGNWFNIIVIVLIAIGIIALLMRFFGNKGGVSYV